MLNTLIGLYAPTSGTAFMGNLDLSRDINRMHTKMGVCQQNDVLWDTLTGEEHLLFYGRIRGLRGQDLQNEVNKMLKNVNLYESRLVICFVFTDRIISKIYTNILKQTNNYLFTYLLTYLLTYLFTYLITYLLTYSLLGMSFLLITLVV